MKTKSKKVPTDHPKSYYTQWNGHHEASVKRIVIPVKFGTTYPELLTLMSRGKKAMAQYDEPYIMFELRYENQLGTFGHPSHP